MENASKALLIAGAILIAIVLISVGMIVLNSTSDVTDQVGDITSSQAAQSFNSNFSSYSGTQKGSSVKQLLGAIAANNKTQADGAKRVITVNYNNMNNVTNSNEANNITTAMSEIVNTAKYTVKIAEVDSDGYISKIEITRK